MTKLTGKDHEYDLLDDAEKELTDALQNAPENPREWFTAFQERYRGLMGDAGWMRTGLIAPKGISKNPKPTLGSVIAEVQEKLGL